MDAQKSTASSEFDLYLAQCRDLVIEEIKDIVPADERYGPVLYDLMLEYPLRRAKGFRPALCMATCRALGGHLEQTLRTAAVLEMYHNAFLIHDDVEDGSLKRRGGPTLHQTYGVPIAVNVGDAMLALSLQPLLDNMALLGLGKALRILQMVAEMARQSAEGQALELFWIRQGRWGLEDDDYRHLVHKKTGWYTFVAPILIGAIIAGVEDERQETLRQLCWDLGIAFQITDDVLNLVANENAYGKEINGDLWEGKHTLILMHAMRQATDAQRAQHGATLRKARHEKTPQEVADLRALIDDKGSIGYAQEIAAAHAKAAAEHLRATADWMPPSIHRAFIQELVQRVTSRLA